MWNKSERNELQQGRQLCLLGDPVSHSLSPQLMAYALAELGEPCSYEAMAVPAPQLASTWQQLCAGPLRGCNITAPHKQTIRRHLDRLDETAQIAQAVNVVGRDAQGLWVGYNTDGVGFIRSLQEEWGPPALQGGALLVGAGGAAYAVASVLGAHHVKPLYIVNRTWQQAVALARYCGGRAVPQSSLRESLPEVQLVVNATPLGWDGVSMPFPPSWFAPQHLVSDLVYRPTPWLRAAKQQNLRTHGGLGMFVHQLSLSLVHWFQRTVPIPLLLEGARRMVK